MANEGFDRIEMDQLLNWQWGLLGPEQLAGLRRTRTLGVGGAVRRFNQLAVPGLGGVWFSKQIVLATLGVRIADRLRPTRAKVKAIEIANAVEALACWCAFRSNDWTSDPRLRGRQKLAGKHDLTFERLRRPRFYVTQPMRMATVEALVALGFVKPAGSQRFNSFCCTRAGKDLVEDATAGLRPFNVSVQDYLFARAMDNEIIPDTPKLLEALSPLVVLQRDARDRIRAKLCDGAGRDEWAARRKNALSWVSSLDMNNPARWEAKPSMLDANHWDALRLGAAFFRARDGALGVLNAIEAQMASLGAPKLSADHAHKLSAVQTRLKSLRAAAQDFLTEGEDPTEARMATDFCRECVEPDPATIIRNLVKRDDRVLRLLDNDVLPGAAFSLRPQGEISDEEGEGPGADNAARVPVPADISGRIRNLYLLDLDLQGRLGDFLNPPVAGESA